MYSNYSPVLVLERVLSSLLATEYRAPSDLCPTLRDLPPLQIYSFPNASFAAVRPKIDQTQIVLGRVNDLDCTSVPHAVMFQYFTLISGGRIIIFSVLI